MFETKNSIIDWLRKAIEYKTNELCTKYSNWNIQVEFLYQVSIKLY